MQVQPYLFFNNCCQEAIDFYCTALGAEVTALFHYKDGPDARPAGMEDKVMHANLRIGDSIVMASDDCVGKQTGFTGFSLTLAAADVAEAEQAFAALANGGDVRMPLAETFWSPRFGMVADRFGVLWMINTVS